MKFPRQVMLSFDIEPDLHTLKYQGVTEGIPEILKILDKHKIKATFFTTCDCIDKHPFIFRNLIKQGHEVAWHGYRHDRFDDLTKKQKEESIEDSLACFKKYLGTAPKGFRAVQHSSDASTFSLLEKYKFSYDASRTPLNILQFLFFPKRIKRNISDFFSDPFPYKIKGILEIPTSSLLFPFVSLVPRVFPRFFQKVYISLLSTFYQNLVFYAHSWDFIKVEQSGIDRKFPHERVIKNLDFVIAYLKSKKFKFIRMQDFSIK